MRLLSATCYLLNALSTKLFYQKNIAFIFAILFVAISGFSFSQTKETDSWSLLKSQDGIEVYSKIVSCETEGFSTPVNYLVYKISNTNSVPQTVGLQFAIHFEEGCNGCGGGEETSIEITLDAGQFVEAGCSNFLDRLSYFILNPSFKDSWTFTFRCNYQLKQVGL